MKFVRFLNSQSKKELSLTLDCSVDLLNKYARRAFFPAQKMAKKIFDLTKGEIDYNDIYNLSEEETRTRKNWKLYKDKCKGKGEGVKDEETATTA